MKMDFREEPMRFSSRGEFISATAHLPADEDAHVPAVLFCHGFTGNRIEHRYLFVRAARRLASAGIGALRFDYGGCGESEGLFEEHTFSNYIEDALLALDFLKQLPGFDSKRLGILGYSLGGSVAAEVAGQNPQLKAAVLWSPGAFPQKLFFERRQELSGSDISSSVEDFIEYDGWAIGIPFIRSLGEVVPVESLAKFPGAVLLCHGLADVVVEPSHSKAFATARNKPQQITRTLFLEESGHGYKPLKEDAKLLKETTRWFSKYL